MSIKFSLQKVKEYNNERERNHIPLQYSMNVAHSPVIRQIQPLQ